MCARAWKRYSLSRSTIPRASAIEIWSRSLTLAQIKFTLCQNYSPLKGRNIANHASFWYVLKSIKMYCKVLICIDNTCWCIAIRVPKRWLWIGSYDIIKRKHCHTESKRMGEGCFHWRSCPIKTPSQKRERYGKTSRERYFRSLTKKYWETSRNTTQVMIPSPEEE